MQITGGGGSLAARRLPVSPLKCVKNEVHNILTILRLTECSDGKRFRREILSAAEPLHIRRFQSFLTHLSAVDDFETTATTLEPFLAVIRDPAASGPITAVALAAINKFVAYGLIRPDSHGASECINSIAKGVVECRFKESGRAAEEVVLLKILNVMIDTLRCPAGDFLSDRNVWAMVKRCYQIR